MIIIELNIRTDNEIITPQETVTVVVHGVYVSVVA